MSAGADTAAGTAFDEGRIPVNAATPTPLTTMTATAAAAINGWMRLRGDSDRFGLALTVISKVDASLYNAPAGLHVYRQLVRYVSNCRVWTRARVMPGRSCQAREIVRRFAIEQAGSATRDIWHPLARKNARFWISARFRWRWARRSVDPQPCTRHWRPAIAAGGPVHISRSVEPRDPALLDHRPGRQTIPRAGSGPMRR